MMPECDQTSGIGNLETVGSIGLSIVCALLIISMFLVFLYVNKRRRNSRRSSGSPALISEETRLCKKSHLLEETNVVDQYQRFQQHSEHYYYEGNRYINVDFRTTVRKETELNQVTVKSDAAVRNRGSCTSSSDSTSLSLEEDNPFLRHRDYTHYQNVFNDSDHLLAESMEEEDQLSDIQSTFTFDEPICGVIGRCGLLEVAFAYDAPMKKMTIHLLQARDLPVKDHGKPSYTQVHVVLLPGRKQKQKTKVRSGDNPQYVETFLFNRICPEEVNNLSVRFRLYGYEKMRRHKLIGECIVSFSTVNLQLHTNIWVPLEPRANTAVSAQSWEVLSLGQSDTSSVQSVRHGGVQELLIGLAYSGTTGSLSVEVVKGSQFRNVSSTKAPDTYVKLLLLSSTGQEIASSKTSIRRAQTNPLFKEYFMFQVALFQLCDVTLMVIVYNKKALKKKERIGWFTLGRGNTSEEEFSHWEDMKQTKGDLLSRWHVLVES